jgi:hypothetical protein
MTEKELAVARIVFDIGNKLCGGNEKSHKLGLLLLHTSTVLITDEVQFNKMAGQINREIYDKDLRPFWNEIYVRGGGVLGSGSYKAIDTDEASSISGIDMEKCLDGLDYEGFNKLQALLPFIKEIESHPPQTETFANLDRLVWAIFISVFKEEAIERLTAIMSLPEYKPELKK